LIAHEVAMKTILFALVLGLPATAAIAADDAPLHLEAAVCASLQGLTIPASAIGLPTSGAVVQTAVSVGATDAGPALELPAPFRAGLLYANGAFCKVIGLVRPVHAGSPDLEFEVNLPLAWNRQALQMGGGGYDGALVTGLGPFRDAPATLDTPLKQGYVTLGSDGGHKGKAEYDASFGLDDEALLNFGQQSIKKTHDAAMAVIKKAYGNAPAHFYFIGGSQGGHEALDAAARYPADYDGVVAHYPAYNLTMLHLGSLNVGRALYAEGGAAWMNPVKVKLISNAVYAACDGLDGAKDGIIGNVAGCQAAFDVKTLRCANGADTGDTCLSDAQLRAVARITSDYKPGFAVAGMDTFPKWAFLEGAPFTGPSNFGLAPEPADPLPLLYHVGNETVKYIITRDSTFDTMVFDPQKHRARVVKVGTIMDVTDISLERFRAKGGRIIITHGTADDLITPYNSIAYYKRQVAQFGQARLDSFMRFYVIPGFGHGFGPFNAKFDSLGVLRDWVENGKAPTGLTAADGNPGQTAGRTRPLCEWPAWPKFTGAPGTENSASSFTCVTR
jgi:pimeloyl-ACP methyl ester carboxylesterase